jgi:succinyl-CoA synthetase beta subunit
MKLYEYQAKELFRQAGLPVPPGVVLRSVAEAQAAGAALSFPVMAKSQLLAGKRGKAGLIRKCLDLGELKAAVTEWLGRVHQGETIGAVLVEKALDIQREMYL